MEYVSSVIESAVRNSFDTNIELRRGLPVGFFRQVLNFLFFKKLLNYDDS